MRHRLILAGVATITLLGAVALIAQIVTEDTTAAPNCPPNSNSPQCRQTPTPAPSPTASPAPTPTPTPNASNDVLVGSDVTVGNHIQHSFGAYQPAECQEAVIFASAQGLEPSPTYDLLIAASDDGVTPRNNQWQNIGNSTPGGEPGQWLTIRRVSVPPATGDWYSEPDAPYTFVGVFANQAQR